MSSLVAVDGRPLVGAFLVVTFSTVYEIFTQPSRFPLHAWSIKSVVYNGYDSPDEIVGMFLSREMADACMRSCDLRPWDRRWEDYTKGTIQAVKSSVPNFSLLWLCDLSKIDVRSWVVDYSKKITQ